MILGLVAAAMAAAVVRSEEAPTPPPTAGAETSTAAPVETWHATTFVSGAMGLRVIDYWSKGAALRAHTLIGGHPITTLVRGERYVVIDALRGEALSIRRAERARRQDATRGRPFGNELEELVAAGGERVEDTRIAGVDAALWRLTQGGQRRSVWVRRRHPVLPLRIELFDRASGQTVSTDYANWRQDLEIPDVFFEPPAGVSLRELDYEAYLAASLEGDAGTLPILYPDLLHGGPTP
jgi:hypothetical protein